MNKEIIESALISALLLINNEIESVVFDELKDEYLVVIEKLEGALKEISKDA